MTTKLMVAMVWMALLVVGACVRTLAAGWAGVRTLVVVFVVLMTVWAMATLFEAAGKVTRRDR